MTIESIIQIRQKPGLFLARKNFSGAVRTGDRLNLLDGGTVVREVGCDGVEIVDVNINRPELVMIAVYVESLRPGDVSEGQTLASIPGAG